MPLEFLKRRRGAETGAAVVPPPATPVTLPEEVVAQEYSLRLYYGAKSSAGVRMKTGPNALVELPSMLAGLARSEIEIIEPAEDDPFASFGEWSSADDDAAYSAL